MAVRAAQPPGAATPGLRDGEVHLKVATFNIGAPTDNTFSTMKKQAEFTNKLIFHTIMIIDVVDQV
jgi:hypothetical protein